MHVLVSGNFLTTIFIAAGVYYFQILCVEGDQMNPSSLPYNETTTCDEFGRYARFNPYSVLTEEWMMFYYWGPIQTPMFIKFSIPTVPQLKYLQYLLNGHVIKPINWTAKMILMTERNNHTYLLVEKGERGEYNIYVPAKGMKEGDYIRPTYVRIKQTGDNRYLGIMICKDRITYAFAKVKEVPKKQDLQDAAARLGFRGRGGRSYLYQGHQWMPIPEAEDEEFHAGMNHHMYKSAPKPLPKKTKRKINF